MKKIILLPVLLLFALSFYSCTKDDEKNYNTLTITSGEFSGYAYTYVPNTGFWSPVNETIRQVHLVMGGTENTLTEYENKMSILFYYSGQQSIDFPSPEWQWVYLGPVINGTPYVFQAEDATLTINKLDDTVFDGTLSGTFVDVFNGSRTITFTMNIRVNLQEI